MPDVPSQGRTHLEHLLSTALAYAETYVGKPTGDPHIQWMRDANQAEIERLQAQLAEPPDDPDLTDAYTHEDLCDAFREVLIERGYDVDLDVGHFADAALEVITGRSFDLGDMTPSARDDAIEREIARYLTVAPEQGDWSDGDHARGLAHGIVGNLNARGLLHRALVDGQPAPAPTSIGATACPDCGHYPLFFGVDDVTSRSERYLGCAACGWKNYLLGQPATPGPTRDEAEQRLADAQQHNEAVKAERDEARAAVVEARDILDVLIEWFGAPDWTGPDLPVDLGRRIATLLGPRSAMDRVRAPWISPTPAAVTRDEIAEVIAENIDWSYQQGEHDAADAVLALFGRSAPEPPATDQGSDRAD